MRAESLNLGAPGGRLRGGGGGRTPHWEEKASPYRQRWRESRAGEAAKFSEPGVLSPLIAVPGGEGGKSTL